MKNYILSIVFAASLMLPVATQADELGKIFAKVNELIAAKNYPKAMEELAWARKEIEKMHQARLGEILPPQIGDFKGGETQFQSALGITNIERTYSSGSQGIKVSISGGGGEGMGGLAGLAKMGMMFGAQPGTDQFRIDGVTASLTASSGSPELTAFLDSGSILTMTAQDGVDAAALKKFAEGFKLSELDSYLRGK
jgi:hypothetical protein